MASRGTKIDIASATVFRVVRFSGVYFYLRDGRYYVDFGRAFTPFLDRRLPDKSVFPTIEVGRTATLPYYDYRQAGIFNEIGGSR